MDTLVLIEPKDMLTIIALIVTPVVALVIWIFRKGKTYDSVDASSGAEAGSWEGYGEGSSGSASSDGGRDVSGG